MQLSMETLLAFFVMRLMLWTKPGHCLENGDGQISNCSLQLKKTSVPEEVDKFKENSMQIIKYDFNVEKDNGPFSSSSTEQHDLLKPYTFVLALDPVGKSLLHLKESFIPMSLFTLDYGVSGIAVDLIQSPPDCLRHMHAEDLEKELKLLVFRNFGNTTSTTLSEGEICNQHVHATEDGTGIVIYNCCKFHVGDNLECLDLEETVWINMLFATVVILQVLLVLYSPSFVPRSSRMASKEYIYQLKQDMELTVRKKFPGTMIDDNFVKVRYTEPLKKTLKKLKKSGVVYTLNVKRVTLDVKVNRLLPDFPVTFVKFLKSFFLHLNMRNEYELADLQPFCNADICKCMYIPCECPWYKCLIPFMWVLAMIVCVSPWLFRVWFFYAFEVEDRDKLSSTLKKKGLSPPYPGSLVLYLTPTHLFFLLLYGTFLLLACYFFFLPHDIKSSIQNTIRESLEQMHEQKKFYYFVKFLAHILFPLEALGFIGIFLLPFWLVVMSLGLIILGFYIFPLVNLTLRLLMDTARLLISICCNTPITHWENNTKLACFWIVLSQGLMLIFAIPCYIVVVECIAFYVEFVVYIIIGMILNSKYVIKFLTLAVIIFFHAYECFSSVAKTYERFAKAVNSDIQPKIGEDLKTAAMQSYTEQQRQAFAVPKLESKSENSMTLFTDKKGADLKWETRRLFLFLDKDDTTYVPLSFFYKIVQMGHNFCPKPAFMMYLMALIEFIWIMLFLGFVMLVVLAFGDAHNISETNQTLATLAGGLLPFAFRKLFKSRSEATVDRDNLRWETKFKGEIDKHADFWVVKDLDFVIKKKERKVNGSVQIILKDNHIWVRKTPTDEKPQAKYIWSNF